MTNRSPTLFQAKLEDREEDEDEEDDEEEDEEEEEEEEAKGEGRVDESNSLTKDSAPGRYGTFIPGSDNEYSQSCEIQGETIAYSAEAPAISNVMFWLAISCVLFNDFVASFDSTLMASIHPVITSYFSASKATPWLSTTFLITSTAFMPLFAPLSDIIGRRTVWNTASIIFAFALVWCAMAPSISSFIAARTLCGLGAGGVFSMGSIILNDLVPIERRAMFQSCLVLAFGFGQASGAALGGLLCDTIGWRGAFWVQIPGFVVCGVVSYVVVPESLGPQLRRRSKGALKALLQTFDFAGMSALALSVTCLILYLNLGGVVLPWAHPALTASLIASVVSGGAFLLIETKVQCPVMPIRLLLGAPLANINYANFLGSLIVAAITFNAPLFFEAVKRDSPTVAGLRLLAPFLALTFSGFLSCTIMSSVDRIRSLMSFGAVMMMVGTVCIAFMSREVSSWVSLLLLVPCSLGQGFLFPITSICVLRMSLYTDHAVVTSTLYLWRKLGSVMGVAISSFVVQNRLSFYLDEYISGSDQIEIKSKVLDSVRSISDLSGIHQKEAIAAYAAALRITFASTVIFGVMLVAFILPTKVEQESKGSAIEDEDDEDASRIS